LTTRIDGIQRPHNAIGQLANCPRPIRIAIISRFRIEPSLTPLDGADERAVQHALIGQFGQRATVLAAPADAVPNLEGLYLISRITWS
jgi:hypothetical protein